MVVVYIGCDGTMSTGSRQFIYEYNCYSEGLEPFVIPNCDRGGLRSPSSVSGDLVARLKELHLAKEDKIVIFTWGGPEANTLTRACRKSNDVLESELYIIDLLTLEGVNPRNNLKEVHLVECGTLDRELLTKDMKDAKRVYQLASKFVPVKALDSVEGYDALLNCKEDRSIYA